MIDPVVENFLSNFKQVVNQILGKNPVIELDGTWPSLGVCDLFSLSLRGTAKVEQREEFLFKGIAAYVGKIVHDTWLEAGVQAELVNGDKGLVLSAVSGADIPPGKPERVELEEKLRELIIAPPSPFLVFTDFEKDVREQEGVVSLVALGLCLGVSPLFEGTWRVHDTQNNTEFIQKALRHLASSSASHYGRLHPDEPLGQVPELYLDGLIYPPDLMVDEAPARVGVRGLQRFFKEYKVSQKEIERVCENLALSADPFFSNAGLAYHTAVSDEIPSLQIVAAAQSRGTYTGVLLDSMYDLRGELGYKVSWMWPGNEKPYDDKRIAKELLLGFLPWVKFSPTELARKDRIQDNDFVTLMYALSNFDWKHAKKVARKMVEETPGDIPLRLQQIYLQILEGKFDKAEQMFAALLSEPEAKDNASMYDMWGMCAMLQGKVDDAVLYAKRAYEFRKTVSHDNFEIINNYGWALVSSGRFEEALSIFDEALNGTSSPLSPLLNKAYVLFELGQHEALTTVEEALIALAPCDLRVFHNIIYQKL